MVASARPSRLGPALAAAVAVHMLFELLPHPGEIGLWLADLLSIPAYLLAGVACLHTARQGTVELRIAWRAFGVGLLAYAGGNMLWTYLELVRHVQPFPSVADLLYLSLPVAFMAGFLKLPRRGAARLWGLTLGLDMALVLGCAALYFWHFLGSVTLRIYAGQPLEGTVALAYPALDLALLAMALVLAVQGGGLPRRPGLLLALGMVSQVVADSVFAFLTARDAYASAAFTDSFWSLAAALIGAAALEARHPSAQEGGVPPGTRWWTLAPFLAVISTTGLQLFTLAGQETGSTAVLLGGGLLTLLVVARQALSVQENARLAAALRDSSEKLELRVAQRTQELSVKGHALDRANEDLRALSRELEAKVIQRTAALAASHAQLSHQAQHDALTGLPNRVLFEDRLAQATHHAARYGGLLAVIFIDLDGFKYVNDTLGHLAGDDVLREVGRRLTDVVRAADTVARLGGDEFVILLTEVGQVADVRMVTHRLLDQITVPILAAGQDVRITASMGVSLSPADGDTPHTLLMNADVAMYDAKQQGKNAVRFYAPSMNAAAQRRSNVERRLRGALARHEFTLHYQPQHDARGTLRGFEALLRWTDPDLGTVSPAEFIPIAEHAGLIVPIGAWVLDEALRQLAEWQGEGLPPVRMAINVSPAQFAREEFVTSVVDTLARHGLNAQWLELELTEQLVVQDIQATAAKMAALSALGVRVAIDDFGAGHSALIYLMRLPVTMLKIDRAFIHDLGRVEGATRIVGAITALAHALGLEVVAEGVETERQLQEVRALGCEFTQGYLLGRPRPAAQARASLADLAQHHRRPVVSPDMALDRAHR
ncbi:bifunctional diguanylate cyclase/phosphodiesterase [Deinococcus sp. KSM4-11]|uniref:putative bifunctional diguanylate cyclase/phosphodiesterase n=1 Tax=Deinococcus sp. KSM4-11 TaxID=2568654 RepID=UPI0010A32977|nr:bifunctional diguanylate cyclase/phosphodiesterase [Deinococcus sp. KSM4-11]THF87389.1 bifunctional diguanylate cyclase/phosphodiesterase [Deinococcus sp. KSM4-11]